jgi:integrase
MRLTKAAIDKIKPPVDRDQAFYRDDNLKGFALRITKSSVKSFVVEKLINRKVRRMTLGRYGELTTEQARKEAQKLLGKIATGIDPIAEKQSGVARTATLRQVWQDYTKARKSLKPKTLYDYENVIQKAFDDWQSKPLLFITKDKVVKRHTLLGEERGEAYANLSMRLLRALFNFAAGQYEDSQGHSLIVENPVKRLSQTRAWYRVERRQSFIKAHELAAWHDGVKQLKNETLRDYLLLILFTGLRRQEAAKLKWENVDLKAKTLTVLDTKNHQDHVLPLSDYLCELLTQRKQNIVNDYVFSGIGKDGYLVEPRRQMAQVTELSGVHFTVHDLRRTFITVAESLDIAAYSLKKLLNHKMNSDVTAGYIVSDVERLRKPMQLITDYILQQISVKTN